MHEQDFHILEGREITLPELDVKLKILLDVQLLILLVKSNVVAHLPNFESDTTHL